MHAGAGLAGDPDRPGGHQERGRAARGPAERPDPGPRPAGHGRTAEARHDPGASSTTSVPARWTRRSRALAGGGEDAKVIAGGQSLLPLLRLRLAYPELLVDVGGLAELRGVTDAGDALVIGARTTHYELVHDPLVAEHCGLLAQAAGDGGRPGGAAPRHARRRARARRPGR